MGWSGGSELFDKVIDAVQPRVPDAATRKAIYLDLIPAFQDYDWDTEDECMDRDPMFDAAYRELQKQRR